MNGEFGDRCRTLRDPRQPGAFAVKARHVHRKAAGVQAPDELAHLPLGPARFEARHEDANRDAERQVHTSHLSKASATTG